MRLDDKKVTKEEVMELVSSDSSVTSVTIVRMIEDEDEVVIVRCNSSGGSI